jgi:hypothetical protein
MMVALGFSETSVLARATWRNIPEDGILHTYSVGSLRRAKHFLRDPAEYVSYSHHLRTDMDQFLFWFLDFWM